MRTVTTLTPAGREGAAAQETATLAYDDRHRRRLKLVSDQGAPFLLNFDKPVILKAGDILSCDDGSLIRVEAAPESLIEVTAKTADELIRLAWHLGNRHLPTELRPGALRIRRDHVIEDMLLKLGANITALSAPFNPEGGAYGHGAVEGHTH